MAKEIRLEVNVTDFQNLPSYAIEALIRAALLHGLKGEYLQIDSVKVVK